MFQHTGNLAIESQSHGFSQPSDATDFIIKIFDCNGKKVRTFIAPKLALQEITNKIFDLESGVYVLNAFLKDTFVKCIRYIKE